MNQLESLKEIYSIQSKHSQYQVLSSKLCSLLDINESSINSRFEKQRLDYILKNVDIANKKILDIGGNTGFFSFESLENDASHITYYEGNQEHARFVELASDILNYTSKININGEYYDFSQNEKYDIVLLLNVLHHLGDDFGNSSQSKELVLKNIKTHFNSILKQTDILIFQLGFNWKGSSKLPLFDNGTKKEMITFIESSLPKEFELLKIGVAENIEGEITYNDLNMGNIKRDDGLGEFLNRPIFIIKKINKGKI